MNSSVQAQTSQTHSRAVIWIDHLMAKIFSMGITGVTPSTVHAHLDSSHLHHKANSIGSGHVPEDPAFFPQVVKAIESCNELLILGPGLEKMALLHYLQAARPGWCFGSKPVVIRATARSLPSAASIFGSASRRRGRLIQLNSRTG